MIRRGIGVQSFVAAGGAGTDADAQAFITAAAITDATQQSAINTLVTSLKSYGIWTKMKAIYPFVGGTASAHKFNLKDPRDLDAAFRLVFSGGWTHSSNGALPNGTNGYANTYLSPSGSLSLNSTHFTYYSRTNNTYSAVPIGTSSTGNGQSLLCLKLDSFLPQDWSCIHNNAAPESSPSRNDGLFTATRIESGSFKVFRNSTAYRNSSTTSTSLSTTNFYVGARNTNNSATQYSALQCAFASIGDGLTDTEAANLYTAVQAYQTTLSRNV